MKLSKKIQQEKGSGRGGVLALLVVLILAGGFYYAYTQSAPLREALHSVKESTQDATTTSRVRTAMLLSKRVSPYNIKVETVQGEVTLTGQVPSDDAKAVAGAIAQDTAGVKQVHNDLGINPTAERNPETEGLGERVADLELRTVINDGLTQNPDLKDKHIDVQVKNKIATLSGPVETAGQKSTADQIAWQASGVQGVVDNINVGTAETAAPDTADEKLAKKIEFELYSTRAVSLKNIQISVNNGTATLNGNASSPAERLLAEKVTQSVDGVKKVIDNVVAPSDTMQQ